MDGIDPYQSHYEEWLDHSPSDPLLDARQALGLFVDEGIYATDDKGWRIYHLLLDLERVQEVLQFAPSSAQLQAVLLRSASFSSEASVLGFDVGYWGGDNYSIICDSIVMPLWHPPPPEDFAALAEALQALNDSLLFPTQAEAAAFRTRCMQFPWAETEIYPGVFQVIQVEAVDARCLARRCS